MDDLIRKLEQGKYFQQYSAVSFKFLVDSYNCRLSKEQKLALIYRFDRFKLDGRVDLENPDLCLSLYLDFGEDSNSKVAKNFYFGERISGNNRSIPEKFNLKTRKYIGTTSMDSELSLIMANMANVGPGKLVYDPFVGTGSLLVGASFFEGNCFGSDIDGRQIRGKGFGINANMKQYEIQSYLMDTLVFDITQHPWRLKSWLDAIITDPPYGVRAGARRIGKTSERTLSMRDKSRFYPQTVVYSTENVMGDLLEFAAKHLKLDGFLSYWLPVLPGEYTPENAPSHPCLEMLYDSEQSFGRWSRRLLTMKKISEYKDQESTVGTIGNFRDKFYDGV